jgi:hypothetical protein
MEWKLRTLDQSVTPSSFQRAPGNASQPVCNAVLPLAWPTPGIAMGKYGFDREMAKARLIGLYSSGRSLARAKGHTCSSISPSFRFRRLPKSSFVALTDFIPEMR